MIRRPQFCTTGGTCCGAFAVIGDEVIIGSTVNDGRAQMTLTQIATVLQGAENPFGFLTAREWADMREHGPAALELAQARPNSWVITTEVGLRQARQQLVPVG